MSVSETTMQHAHVAHETQSVRPRCGTRAEIFRRVAHRTAAEVGRPWAFATALSVILAWAVTGPLFHYSDTWQLVINTGTTIVTFLMVFLIQNTQNRDSHEIHLKLDELIRANRRARNNIIALQELTDDEITELEHDFARLARDKIAERGERESAR
jgi:low affinity Fe/Cu permease